MYKMTPLAYELDVINSKIHPVINIQYLTQYCNWEDPFQYRPKELEPLEYTNNTSGNSEIDRTIYEIERMVDHRNTHHDKEYLVYWKGYIVKDDTWKPSQELKHALVFVKDYETHLQAQQRFKGHLGVPKRHPDHPRKQAPPASVAPETPKRRPGRPRKNTTPPPTSAVPEVQESL